MKKSLLSRSTWVVMLIAGTLIFNGCKCCQKKKAEKEEKKKQAEACLNKCEQTPDPGMCKAYFPKYYYDKKEGKCKEFIWGGCDGVVPFQTLEECEKCDCANKK